jgi:hypothetical protein
MTGRYYLKVPRYPARNESDTKACWHRFRFLCTSLHADGLSYDVQFNLNGDNPHVLITASGTALQLKQSIGRTLTLPSAIPAERCRVHALEAKWFLPENAARRNNHTTHWSRRHARYQELSTMAEETLRAELEYWREMELLSGRRQHYKPGRTDEGVYKADDEVAA